MSSCGSLTYYENVFNETQLVYYHIVKISLFVLQPWSDVLMQTKANSLKHASAFLLAALCLSCTLSVFGFLLCRPTDGAANGFLQKKGANIFFSFNVYKRNKRFALASAITKRSLTVQQWLSSM